MKHLLLSIALFASAQLAAQTTAFGVFLGGANYQGDLTYKHFTLSETNLAAGIFLRRQVHPKICLKANFYAGKISGDDANYPENYGTRGYSFKSSILEGGLNVEWDVLGKSRVERGTQFTKVITPYAVAGVGAVYFNPKTLGPEDDLCLADEDGTFKNFKAIFPVGGGLKVDLNSTMTLGAEVVTHLPFTDYLDGVSQCGEPGNHDWYVFGGLTFQYWLQAAKKEAVPEEGFY